MEEKHNQETDFMKETIKQRPLNRRKLIRRTLVTAAMAVIFGLVACLTFLILEPVISNKLYPEEEPSTVVFVEEPEENEILPEDMIVDDSQMNPEPTPPPVREDELVAQVLSEIKLGAEDYSSIYSSLSDIAKEAQKSMVTVAGVTSDVDWFNNTYENEGIVSGVIVADNGKELLILANVNTILGADSLKITFSDNMEYEAFLKKKDSNTGLAVLAVPKSDMTRNTLEEVKAITLGSSSGSNMAGTPVIALGQPMGVNSVCYGFITSSGNVINLPDSRYKRMTTDIYGSTSATGILINLKGNLIGVIDTDNGTSDTRNLIGAIGITELRSVIQRLSNDKSIPYFGIHGADVTQEVHEELEVPIGAYIMEIDMDSPAMAAGIQSGDILVQIEDKEITTYQELVNCLMEYDPEQSISIGLLRQGPEGYTEIELNAVLSMR
ncbi:MAG: PDZ domain-containing protein [Lachnospiraceae bacterium]|nr:PDZ domain-containing protein [Lachnospiraceae bacterium]MBD5396086.1 PDZ domain-containing protein [Lachnospiraceae bacterium]